MRPSSAPTLPPSISRTWATVIRDGMACGLMTRSGTIPSAVNGMSSWRDDQADDALLPVPRGELVAELGDALVPDLDLDELGDVLRLGQHDAVDPAGLAQAGQVIDVSRRFCGVRKSVSSSRNLGGRGLADEHVPAAHGGSGEISPSSPRLRYESVSPGAPRRRATGSRSGPPARRGSCAPRRGTSA